MLATTVHTGIHQTTGFGLTIKDVKCNTSWPQPSADMGTDCRYSMPESDDDNILSFVAQATPQCIQV